ncbi:MAG: hypothetical protein C0483_11570 [Pirellula sp.]|nr:hypothetical protein [Pirellula sp.]
MHLLAIILQYLLGRFSNSPQKQPALARARSSEASSAEPQALESSLDQRVAAAIVFRARRAEMRVSHATCRAGPDAEQTLLGDGVALDLAPTAREIASAPAVSTAQYSPPLRT